MTGLLSGTLQLYMDRNPNDSVSPLERKLDELATLYFAARQLHSTLSLEEVGKQLSDVVGQFIGADKFVVYVVANGGTVAKACAWLNIPESDLGPVSLATGPLGEVIRTGDRRVPETFHHGTIDEPMAVLPLLAEGKPIGAVSIVAMLGHKTGWTDVDMELMRLLETHAGPALIAASLFQRVESPATALEEALAAMPRDDGEESGTDS